jgi:hypothetical protein
VSAIAVGSPYLFAQSGTFGGPYSYTVPSSLVVEPTAATATFDGSGASGTFLCALSFYAQSGELLSRVFPSQSVASGDTAQVSYAPFPGGLTTGPTPVPTPGMVLIQAITLSASAASFDFTGISQTYTHLMFVMRLRCDGAVAVTNALVRILADSGAHYETVQVNYDSGSVDGASGQTAGSLTALRGGLATGTTADANHFGIAWCLLPNYTINTGDHSWLHHDGSVPIAGTPGGWQSRAMYSQHCGTSGPVTQVTILPGSGSNFVSGSAVSMYGLA